MKQYGANDVIPGVRAMTEHTLQAQIVRILQSAGFITIDGDVMSALRYLPRRQRRGLRKGQGK